MLFPGNIPTNCKRTFLIVDDNPDGRSLLNRTLLRKYPQASITECQDGETAAATASQLKFDAILAHRAGEMDQESLITALRAVAPDTVIVALSGFDRSATALAAGATTFLNYDKWLLVGTVVEEELQRKKRA